MKASKTPLIRTALCVLAVALTLSSCDTGSISQSDLDKSNSADPSFLRSNTLEAQHTGAFDIVEKEYIIIFKEREHWKGVISEQIGREADQLINDILKTHNIERDLVLHRYQHAIKGFAARLSDEQVEKLRNNPLISEISPNILLQLGVVPGALPESNPNVLGLDLSIQSGQVVPWGIQRVGGPLNVSAGKKAWVLDTGIDLDHPDLTVDTYNSVSFIPGESADDGNGHGTHVAGIIAAKNNSTGVVGVAAGASVVSVKVCYNDGRGCPLASLLDGVDYISTRATSANHVVNISIWALASAPGMQNLENSIIAAANNGVKFTLIAGNAAGNANNYSPGRINHQNIWTMSAFDNNNAFATSFSNYGNPPIDFGAPGVGILSLWKNGGTNTLDGTSMSAPHVAGILLATNKAPIINGYVTNDPSPPADPKALADPPLLQIYINGPRWIQENQYTQFNAEVSGGRWPYIYQWQIDYGNGSGPWQNIGGNTSTYTHISYNSNDFNLRVQVTDANNNTKTSTIHSVMVGN